MKKNIFQPKVLLLIVLLILIPGIVFAINTISEGYRVVKNTYVEIPVEIPPSKCRIVENTGTNDYFVPTKTTEEWDAFIANKPGDVTLHSCCDTGDCGGINGIYTAAQYYKSSNCGHTPPCFLEIPIGDSEVVSESSTGGSCGILKKWRSIRCGTLYKATGICHGEPCITGMQFQSNWNQVKFCYGTYDAVLDVCVYEGSEIVEIDGGYAWYGDQNCYNMLPNCCVGYPEPCCSANLVGVGSLGSCSTSLPCGDDRCSSQYGEDCSSCEDDCGACEYVCSDYGYEYACTDAGCYWHSCGFTCSDTPCSEYYYESACTGDGCCWHSYGFTCSDTPCSEYYYESACTGDGCYWDSYNWECSDIQEYY